MKWIKWNVALTFKATFLIKIWVEQPATICYSIGNNFETLGGGLFYIEIVE